jgi:hypothetical protein
MFHLTGHGIFYLPTGMKLILFRIIVVFQYLLQRNIYRKNIL